MSSDDGSGSDGNGDDGNGKPDWQKVSAIVAIIGLPIAIFGVINLPNGSNSGGTPPVQSSTSPAEPPEPGPEAELPSRAASGLPVPLYTDIDLATPVDCGRGFDIGLDEPGFEPSFEHASIYLDCEPNMHTIRFGGATTASLVSPAQDDPTQCAQSAQQTPVGRSTYLEEGQTFCVLFNDGENVALLRIDGVVSDQVTFTATAWRL